MTGYERNVRQPPIGSPLFHRPSWIEIDLEAIKHNLNEVRAAIGPKVKIFASLKRNAGGCGLVGVARGMQWGGADGVALGNIDDAVAIRRADVTLPILLFPNCLPESAPIAIDERLMPTLSTIDDVREWGGRATKTLDVFLKIDTGGYRAGASCEEALAVAQAIESHANLRLAGVYGHVLASYVGGGEDIVRRQLKLFADTVEALKMGGISFPIRMIASSSIVAAHPGMEFDAVDPGRLLLGHKFPLATGRIMTTRYALAGIKSRLVMKKTLSGADRDSIPAMFKVRNGMTIGLIPFGHGDGYPRDIDATASVLIRGRQAAVLPPVHSELMRIDLSAIPDASVGDEVVLLGRSGDREITLDGLASQWKTDIGGVFGCLRDHLPRVYLINDRAALDGR